MCKIINNKGFTLIELLAVMVILASVSLVAVGGISESLKKRDVKECEEQQELAISAAKIYFSLEGKGKNVVTINQLNAMEDGYDIDYFKDDKKINMLTADDKIAVVDNVYEYTDKDGNEKKCE